MHRELVSRLLQRQSLTQPQNALGTHPGPWMRMENPHIPQRPTLGIGQHQAFHGSDSCSNPRSSLLKI
jgi:hypothetical protein